MAKLLKRVSLIFILSFITMSAMLVSGASASYRGYRVTAINEDHTGFYLGTALGADLPTGPDEDGFSAGFGWTIRLGYQFIRNLAIELGYHQSVGVFSSQGIKGTWSFIQLPFIDLKPIIPLSPVSDLYFILGIANTGFARATSNLSSNGTSSSFATGFDLGIGYEGYVTNHISLGGELIYHNLTNNKFSVGGGGLSGTITTPYNLNMSFTSLIFSFLYHF